MAQASAPITAIRIKNILFATDFSDVSSYAIPYLACIARHFGATIFPTYVIPGEPRYEVPMDQLREDLKAARNDAERRFSSILNHPLLTDLPQEILIERGEVWPRIRALTTGYDIDLVVIGTHGHRGLGKVVFGSVAEQIFRQAPCPVLVVGPHGIHHEIEDGAFQRILFATDLSHESLHALPFIADLANAFGAFLKIVSVVQPANEGMFSFTDETICARKQDLDRAVRGLRLVHDAELIVEAGSVGDSILKIADINNVDLIAMGARPSSSPGVTSHVPLGTTQFVASHAHCPVLVVRTGAQTTEQ